MKYVLSLLVGALFLLALGAQPAAAQANCIAIDQPLEDYLAGTEKCSLGETLFSTTTTCKDVRTGNGTVEATFNNPLSVRHVPDGWATWGAPPDAEESTPWVGFNGPVGLTVTLADGLDATTAGLEIENNTFEPAFPVTVDFQNAAGDSLFTITRDVLGRNGSKLFAATCDGDTISQMVVTSDPGAQGFAIAQVRADTFSPLAGAVPNQNIGSSSNQNVRNSDPVNASR